MSAHEDLEDMVRIPDALRMGERIRVHLGTSTAETVAQGQLQAAEVGEAWEWKEEEEHVEVENRMAKQETLMHKVPAPAFEREKVRPT